MSGRYCLRPDRDTVHEKGNSAPADVKQDFVPLLIEKKIQGAESSSLPPPGVQRCEGKLQRLRLPVEPQGQLLVAIHILHLPDIPAFTDGAAAHAQHGHERELLRQSQRISWSET